MGRFLSDQISIQNGHMAMKTQIFKAIFLGLPENHVILPLEMESKDPEEHSTTFKVECAELLAEKFCFVYKNMLLRRQRASARREMSWLDIQAMSFTEYFKQFPELYGKVNLIVYCGFTLLCLFH